MHKIYGWLTVITASVAEDLHIKSMNELLI